MLKAFFTSATGMRAQEVLIDNTSNNLANVNTVGFKRSILDFADLLYSTSRPPGALVDDGQTVPVGVQIGNGVRTDGTTKVFRQGVEVETGVNTDMAIEGEGFFKVSTPNGDFRYTRDGSFRIDGLGRFVNGDGLLLEPAITIPPNVTDLSISPTGQVSYNQNGQIATAGEIQVFRFINPAGLSSEGGNLYAATEASGPEVAGNAGLDGFGRLRQNYLEGSNVEVVSELVSLITAQRAYEINSRAIRAGDEMLSTTSQIVN